MKKVKIFGAIVLAGIMLAGCGDGDSELVKLENKNPTIAQANFDTLIAKIQSEIPNEGFKLYSIENVFNEPFKSKITERTMKILLAEKAENRLTKDDEHSLSTSVLVVNEKDKSQFFIFRISCEDKKCQSEKHAKFK